MTGGLRGRTVLIPRGGPWGERVRGDLTRRGAHGVIAPLIETRAPRDTTARDAAFAALAAGDYAWVFLTSAAAIEQLHDAGVRVPDSTRVAVVGSATARAALEAGFAVDFVPEGRASASSMIAQWCATHEPATTGRCLVLRSDLAMAVVSDELEVRGHDLEVCIAYRTVGLDLSADVVDALRTGSIDTVLVTSASVARELAAHGDLPGTVRIGSLGPATTREARRHGLDVAVTSPTQTIEALLDALDDALEPASPQESA